MKHKKKLAAAGSIVALATAAILFKPAQDTSLLPRPEVPPWLVPRTNTTPTWPRTNRLNYGAIPTTNYSWDVLTSTNLVDWTLLASNVGPGDITFTNDGRPRRFFRMRGRP